MQEKESRTTFIHFHPEFKFKLKYCINQTKSMLFVEGILIQNNGATVPINNSYQEFISDALNDNSGQIFRRTVFSVHVKFGSLFFTSKINNISSQNEIKQQLKAIQTQVMQRKQLIICLLAVLGFSIDQENALMRKLLSAKKQLKNKITDLMKLPISEEKQKRQSQLILENEFKNQLRLTGTNRTVNSIMETCEDYVDNKVTYFGEGTDWVFQKIEDNSMKAEEEISESKGEKIKSKKKMEGGYFNIEHCRFKVQNDSKKINQQQNFVVKTLKDKHKNSSNFVNNIEKLEKELALVEQVKFKKYILNYYRQNSKRLDYVLMQPFEHSLQDYIYYIGDSLPIEHKIKISQQIVKAVISLHYSDIVHRDIKPSNFLIDDTFSGEGFFKLKIIDFAQSFSKNNRNYKEGDYACSHPYSPIQCTERKAFTSEGEPGEGVGAKQIDYWSVGLTIYEVFFRKLAVSFSRAFYVDIANSWGKQLLLAVNQRQKCGFQLVEDIITIICIKELKCEQKERMKLSMVLKILQYLQEYVHKLMNIVDQSKKQ